MDFEKMTTAQALGTIVGKIAVWFISAAFIWWGWNIFAWHFNLPQLRTVVQSLWARGH